MGDLSDKLEDGLARFAALDEELDAALKDMGLPGLTAAAEGESNLSQLPVIMRLCTILPLSERHTALREALNRGGDPNARCPWGAMAVDTLYADGDAVGLSILLDFGADASDYQWSDAHIAVIHGNLAAFATLSTDVRAAKDHLGDTPFLLACRFGAADIAGALVDGDALHDAGLIAAKSGSLSVMKMLVDAGLDINVRAEDGNTALLQAVEAGQAKMVGYLLEHGASVDAVRRVNVNDGAFFGRSEKLQAVVDKMMSAVVDFSSGPAGAHETSIYDAAFDPAIVRLLATHGADAAQFQDELFPVAIGVDQRPAIPISRDEFAAQYRVRRGRTNPEAADVPFWTAQIRSGQSGYQAKFDIVGEDTDTDGPVWSFRRFGRTATRLPDGRLVLIGGEHEDHYDPDFCIYNDVTVVAVDGQVTHYTYPVNAFPPTDFHSATLHGDGIWIIGNLGYSQHRKENVTQVMWLSLIDFSVHHIVTTGKSPGWVHRHNATCTDGTIHIAGGKTEPGHVDLRGGYVLDLTTRIWHAVN